MARIDDFKAAKELSLSNLVKQDAGEVAQKAGYALGPDKTLEIPFLDKTLVVKIEEGSIIDKDNPEKEVPLQEQVLILHYLEAESNKKPSQDWVAYREIPGGTFYFSAFVKRAIDPLKKVFGEKVDALKEIAPKVGGTAIEQGDAGFEFSIFPRIPIQMILYEGDEEFPPEANILFDRSAGDLMSPEDLAWLAGLPVYRMIGLFYSK